jgi:hypothetical protein
MIPDQKFRCREAACREFVLFSYTAVMNAYAKLQRAPWPADQTHVKAHLSCPGGHMYSYDLALK